MNHSGLSNFKNSGYSDSGFSVNGMFKYVGIDNIISLFGNYKYVYAEADT